MNDTSTRDRRQHAPFHPFTLGKSAFSLIELLAVVSVMALLMGIVAPAMSGMMASTRLASAGQMVEGLFGEAQQLTAAQGRPVEVRMYRSNVERRQRSGAVGDPVGYDSFLIVTHYAVGEPDPTDMSRPLTTPMALAAFGGVNNLPNGLVITDNARHSTLISEIGENASGGESQLKVRRGANLEDLDLEGYDEYRSFLFLPEGTNLLTGEKWFLTIMNEKDVESSSLPKQFFTIQVDPVTSRISSYRP